MSNFWKVNTCVLCDQELTASEAKSHKCEEKECDHEGHVVRGRCEKCGERYESDYETFEKENPR